MRQPSNPADLRCLAATVLQQLAAPLEVQQALMHQGVVNPTCRRDGGDLPARAAAVRDAPGAVEAVGSLVAEIPAFLDASDAPELVEHITTAATSIADHLGSSGLRRMVEAAPDGFFSGLSGALRSPTTRVSVFT